MAPSSRHISHSNVPPTNLDSVQEDIQDALVNNVRRVHRHTVHRTGVYIGSAGVFLMDRKTAPYIPLNVKSSSITSLLQSPLTVPHSGAHASFLETCVGPAILILVEKLCITYGSDDNAVYTNDKRKLDSASERCVQLLEASLKVVRDGELDDDGCEVLYGRAGLLYALLLLRIELKSLGDAASSNPTDDLAIHAIDAACSDTNVQTLVDDIMRRGKIGAQDLREELASLRDERDKAPPLMWRWHGWRYLGGAHGVAGILQMVICAPARIIEPHWSDIIAEVEWLLAIQEPLGNWPSKAGRHMYYVQGGTATSAEAKRVSVNMDGGQDALVQWCHGAPGVLILLSTLLTRTSGSPTPALALSPSLRERITAALTRGGMLVYTHGLLRKGVGLCHGVGGSVYALLAVSDALDRPAGEDRQWLARAAHLAHLATEYGALERRAEMRVPDEPYSLYEGVAGMCCAWAEVLGRLGTLSGGEERRRRGMPGYNDLAVEDED